MNHPSTYAYKLKTKGKTFYFCGWNCKAKSDKANPATFIESTGKWVEKVPIGRWERDIE